jgi:ribosome-associated toxin RatA of RatAB toxin-antitoxin module
MAAPLDSLAPMAASSQAAPCARRRFGSVACGMACALVAMALAGSSATAGGSAVKRIEVRPTEQGYTIDLVMWAPVRREVAFDVLVDFEHIPDWSPDVRQSRVLKRDDHSATVEYSGRLRFGILPVPFTTVRDVEFTSPALIETNQVKGTLRRHQSRTVLTTDGAGTRLNYHLEMEPAAVSAALVNKDRVEHQLKDTFEAAAGEMVRRSTGAAPSPR